ncbi:MAG TPA: extracellular solute-binding protein [Acidimicrobiia bacterium]|nr:extracellular solute-binding protein [Acidimicrobiia bacterium]
MQWSHYVPEFDQWFDDVYTKRWGEEHDVDVVVDHIEIHQLPSRAEFEASTQRGHDIFHFVAPAPGFEDLVIDHGDIVEEVVAKVGPMIPLVERSVFNPKTGKWFGFCDNWSPAPVHYRADLWDPLGARPDTWDDVLAAAGRLRSGGHPLGFPIARGNFDAQVSLLSLLHAYGASVQDEAGQVVVNRPETVEALKMGAALYREGMTEDVFAWDGSANNRFLAEGKGSLIVNAISALRAIEAQDPELAAKIRLAPTPAGPAGRQGVYLTGNYVIWKFSKNQALAKRFLVDLVLAYREFVVQSRLYNLPAFPGSVPDLGAIVAGDPGAVAGTYDLLGGAEDWSTNLGHPGYSNAAMGEVQNQYVVPDMFLSVCQGEATPEEAARAAEARATPIFEKWQERGKI